MSRTHHTTHHTGTTAHTTGGSHRVSQRSHRAAEAKLSTHGGHASRSHSNRSHQGGSRDHVQVSHHRGTEGAGAHNMVNGLQQNFGGHDAADAASGYANRHFKSGQTKRCADFVSSMIEQSGHRPPGFQHQESAGGLARYGSPVGRGNLQKGDMVFFGNTYKKGQYTHVGIYMGNGQFIHRPTANKPVQVSSLDNPYYSSHFTGGRHY